jgi:hypothetical protein
LISARKTAATGLPELADGAISRDQATRFLAREELNGKLLRLKTKKLMRQHENGEVRLIFDDAIVEKARVDRNEIIRRQYERSKAGNISGKITALPCVI